MRVLILRKVNWYLSWSWIHFISPWRGVPWDFHVSQKLENWECSCTDLDGLSFWFAINNHTLEFEEKWKESHSGYERPIFGTKNAVYTVLVGSLLSIFFFLVHHKDNHYEEDFYLDLIALHSLIHLPLLPV